MKLSLLTAKSRFTRLLVLALVAVVPVLGGCGKSKTRSDTGGGNPFSTADQRTQAAWEKVQAAANANDYATAVLGLRSLQAQTNLSADQRQLVDATSTSVSDKLSAAAQKGDPAALKAMDDIRKGWRGR